MKTRIVVLTLVALLVIAVIAGSCVRRLITDTPVRIWTPAPVSGALVTATQPAVILPTVAPVTATRVIQPPTPATERGAPAQDATPDPKLVVITEADVLRLVESGVMAQNGATVEDLTVRFAEEKMTIRAARLTYGAIIVENLNLVGRLVAVDGKLQLETESVSPRGLVTALIPTFANQALAQYAGQWYVEEVRTLDGRLELRTR